MNNEIMQKQEEDNGGVFMRKVLLSLTACSLLLAACNDASVGVIGGADGPTSIIVSESEKSEKGQFGVQLEKKPVRMFNASGELYYDTGLVDDTFGRCGTLDGELKRKAKENEIPQKSGEANFDAEGYQNATSITKEVCIDGEWIIFKKYDADKETLRGLKYCYYIKGRLNNAAKDSEMIVLSDYADVTFDDVNGIMLSSEYPPMSRGAVHFNYIGSDNRGITLYAEDVTPKGLTLKIEQLGGKNVGELQTGAWFELEKSVNEKWVPVETDLLLDYAWNDVAYIINKNDITELNVEWDWLYGELDNGYYRLTKEIMNIQEEGLFDKDLYTVCFTVE